MSAFPASVRRPLGILFLCLSLVLVITTSALSQDDDVATDKQLTLQIDAPKGEFAVGDEALVTLTATNAGEVLVEAVTLHLHDQPGVEWSKSSRAPGWNWATCRRARAGSSKGACA